MDNESKINLPIWYSDRHILVDPRLHLLLKTYAYERHLTMKLALSRLLRKALESEGIVVKDT